MATREEWLEAGAGALADGGAPAVRIDKLAAALGTTKGSYYHHFDGVRGFRRALLEHLEASYTHRLIELTEAAGGTARQRLRTLLDLVLGDAEAPAGAPDRREALQVALRAWAHQEPDALHAQRRIDAARTGYLRELWAAAGAPPPDAEAGALLTHAVIVGGRHLVPALDAAQLRRVYDLVLRLVPEEDP